ncbi:MAG: tyrosine-type recombinase/integrase [Terriglobales bacterium]
MLKNENQREAVVEEKDFQRLLKACDWTSQNTEGDSPVATVTGKTIRALFTVMYDCGIRAGEACPLEWSTVNIPDKWVFIASGKTKAARRRVGLTRRAIVALRALRALRPKARYCFTRHNADRPLTVGWVSHKFMRLRRALELPDGVVLHSLRHSCATRLGNAGANVLDLPKVMGWSSPVIAARYVHLDEARMQTLSGLLEV